MLLYIAFAVILGVPLLRIPDSRRLVTKAVTLISLNIQAPSTPKSESIDGTENLEDALYSNKAIVIARLM